MSEIDDIDLGEEAINNYKTNLKTLRLAHDLSRKQVALDIGISEEYVRLLEDINYQKHPSLNILLKFARYYRISLSDLFQE